MSAVTASPELLAVAAEVAELCAVELVLSVIAPPTATRCAGCGCVRFVAHRCALCGAEVTA